MMKTKKMSTEFEYVMSVSEKLEAGKWIAVVGNSIVAQGDKGKDVFDEARRSHPKSEPFVMKVPSDAVMLM